MVGKIYLSKNQYSEYNYMVEVDDDYGYCISINTDLSDSFQYLISDYHDLDEFIDSEIKLNMLFVDNSLDNISLLKTIKEQKEKYLMNAEYVEINFDIDSVICYIKNNPILRTKKIIISEYLGLSSEILNKIYVELNGNVDNLYFNLFKNTKLITFDECVNTFKKMDEMVERINRYDFSPIEKIMYIYDLVRDRIYSTENDNSDMSKSRDLSSVLLNENIVCLGYARIFSSLLQRVGINSREVLLLNEAENSGHARNEVYIKDDKYNIDGIYYFDPTWDSRRNENDNLYLYSYKYFAKTKSYMDEMDCGKIKDIKFPYFSYDMDCEFIDTVNEKGFDGLSEDMIRSVNYMSTLLEGKYLIEALFYLKNSPLYGKVNAEEISEKISDLIVYFERPLYAEVLLEALYNVRKVQYYEESEKFPFSLEDFYIILKLSDFGFGGENAKERMLVSIFGKGILTRGHLDSYDSRKLLSKNIESVRLARTLRKIYDNIK